MQQAPAGPILMEDVKKTNVVVIRNILQEQGRGRGETKRKPYAIEVDKRRNCYNCRGFARHCRNRGTESRIRERRRLEYRRNKNNEEKRIIEEGNGWNNNLNGDRDLIVPD